jgi:hypothetical protein
MRGAANILRHWAATTLGQGKKEKRESEMGAALFAAFWLAIAALFLWRAGVWVRRGYTDASPRAEVVRSERPAMFWLYVAGVGGAGVVLACVGLVLAVESAFR